MNDSIALHEIQSFLPQHSDTDCKGDIIHAQTEILRITVTHAHTQRGAGGIQSVERINHTLDFLELGCRFVELFA